MSSSRQNAMRSPSQRLQHPDIPDFAALAATLQETAQALLALCPVKTPEQIKTAAQETSSPQKGNGEIRSYYVAEHILEEERELLAQYDVDVLAHALQEIYNEFYLFLLLMKGYSASEDVEGFTLHLIGEHLSRPLHMFSKACSILVDFDRVPEA